MATRTGATRAAPQAADSHDLISVHGARVNNLKDVSVEIPKRRLTISCRAGRTNSVRNPE
jgi:hypothetical protein